MARPPLPAPSRPAGHPPLSRRAIPGNGGPAKPHDADLPESPPGPVNGLRPPDKESSALPFPSPLMSASPSLPLWDRPPLASAQTAPPPGVRPDGRPRWPTALRAGRPSQRRSGGSARAMRQATSRIRGWRPRPFPSIRFLPNPVPDPAPACPPGLPPAHLFALFRRFSLVGPSPCAVSARTDPGMAQHSLGGFPGKPRGSKPGASNPAPFRRRARSRQTSSLLQRY
jgi:hypothetical protein